MCEIKPLNECALEANSDPTKQKLLVCVCATTGKGEMPANGAKMEATLLEQKVAGQAESLAGESGSAKSGHMACMSTSTCEMARLCCNLAVVVWNVVCLL